MRDSAFPPLSTLPRWLRIFGPSESSSMKSGNKHSHKLKSLLTNILALVTPLGVNLLAREVWTAKGRECPCSLQRRLQGSVFLAQLLRFSEG